MKIINTAAWILLIVGGLNWGIVGIADINPINWLFESNAIEKIIYILVGLSAIYAAASCCKCCKSSNSCTSEHGNKSDSCCKSTDKTDSGGCC